MTCSYYCNVPSDLIKPRSYGRRKNVTSFHIHTSSYIDSDSIFDLEIM